MRWNEVLYILAVLGLALPLAAHTLGEAFRIEAAEIPVAGSAGTARDVDMDALRRRIREGALSDREALFWRSAPALSSRRTFAVMGTDATVIVTPPGSEEVLDSVEGILRRIDALMSTYREDSEITRFNTAGSGPVSLSDETLRVIRAARQLHEATEGALDVTCRPVIEMWRSAETVPSEEALQEARRSSAWDQIEIGPEGVRKLSPSASLDLGAVAKGYAIDVAVEAIRDGMVEVGGDLRCVGTPETGRKWRVALRHPFRPGDRCGEIAIGGGAVCTSGDYGRYRIIDGKRYSHIVDPRDLHPVEGPASVTVVAPTAVVADGWATAISVVDRLPDVEGIEALIISGPREAPGVRMTEGFRQMLVGPLDL
jgi:thiamine biosynthesis lipoprotein